MYDYEIHVREIMDTCTSIMFFFMERPALLILVSPTLSYLPHGSSEGWSSEILSVYQQCG